LFATAYCNDCGSCQAFGRPQTDGFKCSRSDYRTETGGGSPTEHWWVSLGRAVRCGPRDRSGEKHRLEWAGRSPEYPTFPITKGLTGAAVAGRETVNVGDVAVDPRYLTAFGTTRSEIIVPVFDLAGDVAGTIDVESETPHAFTREMQVLLEACSDVIRPLWHR